MVVAVLGVDGGQRCVGIKLGLQAERRASVHLQVRWVVVLVALHAGRHEAIGIAEAGRGSVGLVPPRPEGFQVGVVLGASTGCGGGVDLDKARPAREKGGKNSEKIRTVKAL